MRIQPYPYYKNNGNRWLGWVPEHWALSRLKFVLNGLYSGGTPNTSIDENWCENDGIHWVSIGDMSSTEFVYTTAKMVTPRGVKEKNLRIFESGTLLLSMYASLGHVAELVVPATINQAILALIPSSQYDKLFLKRWLQYLKPFLSELASSNTQDNLNAEKVKNLPVVIPPLSEQRTIASFLDRETAKLDQLVEKKQRLIELLQEKRQALITQAVTKGLDPNVPMKDSGIPWLGEVPAHWQIVRLKFIAEVRSGVTKGRDLTGKETVELPYLRVANVQDGYLDLSDVATIPVMKSEIPRYSLRKGDVLMNEGGDFDKLGRGTRWNGEIEPCLHQNHVFAVRPHDIDYSDWINLYTSSEPAKRYFILKSKQTTNLASISSTNIQELQIPFPDKAERDEILEYVSSVTKKLDRLVSVIEHQVDLLREYRQALITAAVTGQIDVRQYCLDDVEVATP